MKTFIIIACFAVVAFAKPQHPLIRALKDVKPSETPRIISGEPAEVGQFPWQASVTYYTPIGLGYFCGGALISSQWVLTAAHCASNAVSFTITLGGITVDGQEDGKITVYSTKAIVHESYNPLTLNNDLAVIQLDEPVEFTDNIQPITLPAKGDIIGEDETLRVSGWGKTSDASGSISNTLNFVDLRSISNEECASIYGPSVISSTLCCRGNPEHSTCNGDSGGPLIIQRESGDVHVGVVSFVHIEGCESGNPSGYVRTESYLDWILENTGVA